MKIVSKSLALALLLGTTSGIAAAQDMRSASEKVVACQTIEDAAQRLVCFETAATELSLILSAPAPQAAPAPVAVQPAAPTEQASTTVAPAAPAPTTTTAAPAAQQQVAATTPEAEAPKVPKSSLPAWIPRVTFGSNRDVEKEPDEYRTTITRIQRNRIGRHFFTTAEGHVWKQKKIEEIRAPKTIPAEAILSQNVTGGILIKIVGTNRSYRVDRVE